MIEIVSTGNGFTTVQLCFERKKGPPGKEIELNLSCKIHKSVTQATTCMAQRLEAADQRRVIDHTWGVEIAEMIIPYKPGRLSAYEESSPQIINQNEF